MPRQVPFVLLLAAFLISAAGCDSRTLGSADGAALLDGAQVVDGGGIGDTGGTADAGGSDAGPPDAGPVYPACGSNTYAWRGLIAGKGDPGYDADLDKLARAYDRAWTVFNAAPFGMNTDITLKNENAANRALVEGWVRDRDDWDFKAYAGKDPIEVVDSFGDAVGMYGGAAAAADAYRYATLRDRGEDCAEIAQARAQLLRVLDALHVATDITGVPGVIARSIRRTDWPGGENTQTTPLFDENGSPLPPEKNNGTMRADNSAGGIYPEWAWNDSCSRDMLVGWAQAYGAVWEAIGDDPSFDPALKARLREDARLIGTSLSVKRESGYDLEVRDADGRITFHGILNENSIDRAYVKDAANGFYAVMALGIVSALAYVSGDEALQKYVKNDLIRRRGLHRLSRDSMQWVNLGEFSNFSNYNMAFTGAWLALRYTPDAEARAVVAEATGKALYDVAGSDRQPVEMKQSWFDVIYAYAKAGGSVFDAPAGAPDEDALARGTETLKEFPFPPFWDVKVVNCDDAETASGRCMLNDGSEIGLLGNVGWGNQLVADRPIPMRVRPPSNYYWRSNPYEPNGGGDGSRMIPAADFRGAYWTGRFVKR